MRSNSSKAKGNHLARLIHKYGGWLEDDGDTVRFPSPHAMTQFFKALDADKTPDT
jgi:hypothetical protein